MAKLLKTPLQKLSTKVAYLISKNPGIADVNKRVKVKRKILFTYHNNIISYTHNRYYPTKIQNIIQEDFEVSIPINSDNLNLLPSNLANPPQGAKVVIDLFRKNKNPLLNKIVIGYTINQIDGNALYVTKDFYKNILSINSEEGKHRTVRFNNRAKPFLEESFKIKSDDQNFERDYSLLLREVIASGQITQQDLIQLVSQLEIGDNINVVIEKQIIKQAEWLIEKINELLDLGTINTTKAKEFGNTHFGFPKASIKGPEHLMEKILTKYGKYTLFGVPVLINTDKYVVNANGLSNCQFDIILINHLSDIEVVELKRSDTILLDYDENRNKFYASKELSVAVSQAERYISAVYRDNDEDYKINNQKIRDYLNEQIGGEMKVEIVRPKALIILGSYLTIAPNYNEQSQKTKNKVTKKDYNTNYLQAYKELKEAYKNIHILTYSELVEIAKTRLLVQENE